MSLRHHVLSRESRAFTLIEILTAMGVILVLAGLTLGVSGVVRKAAREKKAQALIAQIDAALKAYYDKVGFYPPSRNFTSGVPDLEVFYVDKAIFGGGDSAIDMTDFLQISKGDRKYVGTENASAYKVKDPFTPDEYIYYRCPGKFNPTAYDLASKGLDGKWGDGTDAESDMGLHDDVCNFKRSKK